ncbi:MAG: RDD family protein [Verrucomicrobiota bacterium]
MSQITILNQANVPLGPFTREQVSEKLQRGEITLGSLAYVEGLAQWTPLRDVLARVDGVAAMPPAPPVPAVAPGGYSYAATMEPPAHLLYAGFWRRFLALIADSVVLSPLSIIAFTLNPAYQDESARTLAAALVSLVYAIFAFIIRWLYFALMESGGWQATLGKKLIGIRVTDLEGRRIGFGRATGRYFGKIISCLTLFIGFIMAGFTERKQALHDMLAGTLVVRDR